MPIFWRDQMSIQNDLLDQDHRYLFCLVNSIELSLKHADLAATVLVFKQLMEYSVLHFTREEKVQIKIKYPAKDLHRGRHEEIIKSLSRFHTELGFYERRREEGLFFTEAEDAMGERLLKLLHDWIVEHVLTEDRKMEPLLKQFPKSFQ